MIPKTDPGKLSLFWVLQISGWLLYGVIYYLIFYSYKDLDLANTFGFAVTYMVAFVVTIAMRKIYQRLDYQHRSLRHCHPYIYNFCSNLGLSGSVCVLSHIWNRKISKGFGQDFDA